MYSLILHGRRSIELQRWRHLNFLVQQNVSAFSSSLSSASAADANPKDIQKGKKFTVSYLTDSLGLTKKLAESISKKVSFEDKSNPDSVLSLFRSYGFTDSQISSIISDYPVLLTADADKSIAPKLQVLQSRVTSTSELTDIVSKAPKILGKNGIAIVRYFDFVKEIIEADMSSKFQKLCNSVPQDNRIRNLSVLRELGVPQRRLFPLLISYGNPLYGKEKFDASVKKIVEMGFDPTTSKFVLALRVVQGSKDETIEDKMDIFKKLGFSVDDIWVTFKKFPMVLGLSKEKILNNIEIFRGLGFSSDEFAMIVKGFPQCIGYSAELVKKKTEFLVKKMNWPLKTLVANPAVFGYSLEKRTVPRCNVIKALISKGLLDSERAPMSSMLVITDQNFLDKYVMNHDDKQLVTELTAIFTRDRVSLTDHLISNVKDC